MTLVTTPGDPNADSYVSLVEAAAYFTKRGETTFAALADDAAREVALRRSTAYLDNQYRARWMGINSFQVQSLAWPRVDGLRGYYRGYTQQLLDLNGWPIPIATVPQQVKDAVCEVALLYVAGVTLEPRLVRGGLIKSQRDKVDVLETETVYMDGASVVDRFLVVEGLLRGLVISFPGQGTGAVPLVRS
jgi:hypothetical protein